MNILLTGGAGYIGSHTAVVLSQAGHEVVLISGPVAIRPPSGLVFIGVTTAEEMGDAVDRNLGGIDILVMSAAVADFLK